MNDRWKAMNRIRIGHGDHRRVGHDLPPGHVELLEVVDADHDRAQFLGLDRHQRPEVLVPSGRKVRIATVAIAGPASGMTMLR